MTGKFFELSKVLETNNDSTLPSTAILDLGCRPSSERRGRRGGRSTAVRSASGTTGRIVDLSQLELTNGARLAVEMSQATAWVRDPAILEKLRGQRKWTIVAED